MTPGYQFILDLITAFVPIGGLVLAWLTSRNSTRADLKRESMRQDSDLKREGLRQDDSIQARHEARQHDMVVEDRRQLKSNALALLTHYSKARRLCLSIRDEWNTETVQKLSDHFYELDNNAAFIMLGVKSILAVDPACIFPLEIHSLRSHVLNAYTSNRHIADDDEEEKAYQALLSATNGEYSLMNSGLREIISSMMISPS